MKNQKGFTLVELMIVAGLVGMISFGIMSVISNLGSSQKSAESFQDLIDLKNEVSIIMSKEENCSMSLAGGGPFKFYKKDNDEENKGEGVEAEIWLADQVGSSRLTKKFSSTLPTNKHNNLLIKNIKLVFNNGKNFNYLEQSSHSDNAELWFYVERKNKNKTVTQSFKTPLEVNLQTDSSGQTTITGCTSKSQEAIKQSCIQIGTDGPGYGTALCWNRGGTKVSALKTANGDNPDYGIGTNLIIESHDISINIGGCLNVGYDGMGYGTVLCWEEKGNKVVPIKTANGNNPDHGIGNSSFHSKVHSLPISQIDSCTNVGYDGKGYGTILCREKSTPNIIYMKSADGNNPSYGIGAEFRISTPARDLKL